MKYFSKRHVGAGVHASLVEPELTIKVSNHRKSQKHTSEKDHVLVNLMS